MLRFLRTSAKVLGWGLMAAIGLFVLGAAVLLGAVFGWWYFVGWLIVVAFMVLVLWAALEVIP